MRRRPPWWPPNEPWPPRHRWKHPPSSFLWRIGCLFGPMIFLSVIGARTLLSLAFNQVSGPPQGAAIVFGILFVVFVLILILRSFGLPLRSIIAAADRVAAGDYSTRLAEKGPRSLRSVARAFNSMTDRLRANEETRRNLMADIAHELRTPLSVMQGRLEALVDGVYPRDDEQLQDVLDEIHVLARLVEDLRTLANAESGALTLRKESSDLAVLIHDAATSLSSDLVRMEIPDLPLIEIDPLRIREVLINLLSNAIRYARTSVVVTATSDRDAISVSVSDDGAGIPTEELPKIFDRFYKGAGSHGSGLGLTIARNLVEAHGGTIRAESVAGKGTTITFSLPLLFHN